MVRCGPARWAGVRSKVVWCVWSANALAGLFDLFWVGVVDEVGSRPRCKGFCLPAKDANSSANSVKRKTKSVSMLVMVSVE